MKTFYHRGSHGDIVYSMPSLKKLLASNLILKNQNYFEFFEDLMLSQNYIKKVSHLDQPGIKWGDIDINLDAFRPINKKDRSKHLVYCHSESIPVEVDLSEKWIEVEGQSSFPIVINRTKRYHDKQDIDWKALKPLEDICQFVGFEDEYSEFVKITGVRPSFLTCKNALELARIIAGSRLFVGNQSLGFAIAEGLKQNRVLEVCENQPNCTPITENGYTGKDLELAIEKYLS